MGGALISGDRKSFKELKSAKLINIVVLINSGVGRGRKNNIICPLFLLFKNIRQ